MSRWPRSTPDYKWPPHVLSRGRLRRAGRAAVFHLSHLAGRAVTLFRGDRPAILVIRTDGIGDAVLAEPMLRSVAARFADHQVHLWAPAATCELLRASPCISRFVKIPRGYKEGNLQVFSTISWRAKLGYLLGRQRFTAAIYLCHSPEPLGNWLLAGARAGERWYAPGNTDNQFAAQRDLAIATSTHLMLPDGVHKHDLKRNAELARHWGSEIEQCMPSIVVDEPAYQAAAEQARTWRRVAGWMGGEAIVGLMPAASMAVKKYPASAWAHAAAALWERGVMCAIIGGPADELAIEEVAQHLRKLPYLRMKSPLDLPAMAALIGSLDGLMSVDTGLAHVALAQDVPTVVLVGGGHPERFFPWPIPRRATVLNHRMPCEGCRCRCHLNQPECLTRIDPAQIVAAMSDLLKLPARRPMRAVG